MKRSASNPPLNFTAASVASIKPQDKRVTYRDSQIRELGLQVNPGGYRSYFWYGKVRGRPTWETIGSAETTSVAQARDKARALTGKLTAWKLKDYEGPNPFEKIDRATTLGALIENYIVRKVRVDAKRPEHAEKQIRWATDRYLGGWKSKRLADIRRKDVLNLRDDLGESAGHTMANRMIEIIRALFNWAHDKEIFDGENPAARIDKFAEKKRTRYLQPDELAKLERALASEPNPDLVDFVRLSLHLGARKSDVLGMQWRDLALTSEGPLWNVPETTKSGKTYVIPLTPEAGAILTRRLGACGR
jgi:integrase